MKSRVDFHKYINNGTHIWFNIKAETIGEITIAGTIVIPGFPIIVPLIRKVNLH